MDESIFSKVEKRTSVKKEDIISLAKTVTSQDLSSDESIRNLIKKVAKLANKEVSKEKEEKIINAIKKDKVPKSFDEL
ncbi:MAG: stage VI sporulation protein F [Bacilli bacterium]|nr:stage VI sporulation protein F [Bacillales bacterium]